MIRQKYLRQSECIYHSILVITWKIPSKTWNFSTFQGKSDHFPIFYFQIWLYFCGSIWIDIISVHHYKTKLLQLRCDAKGERKTLFEKWIPIYQVYCLNNPWLRCSWKLIGFGEEIVSTVSTLDFQFNLSHFPSFFHPSWNTSMYFIIVEYQLLTK